MISETKSTVYAANGLNQYGTVTSGGVTDNYTYNRWGALTGTRSFSYGYYDNLLYSVYTNRTQGQSRVCAEIPNGGAGGVVAAAAPHLESIFGGRHAAGRIFPCRPPPFPRA